MAVAVVCDPPDVPSQRVPNRSNVPVRRILGKDTKFNISLVALLERGALGGLSNTPKTARSASSFRTKRLRLRSAPFHLLNDM